MKDQLKALPASSEQQPTNQRIQLSLSDIPVFTLDHIRKALKNGIPTPAENQLIGELITNQIIEDITNDNEDI